ncbi:MAG: hypothetical protein GY870_15465 [archaeon]|nr:hypothetical protein [archaeon]
MILKILGDLKSLIIAEKVQYSCNYFLSLEILSRKNAKEKIRQYSGIFKPIFNEKL